MARSAVWLLAATLLLGMAPAGAGEVVVAPAAPGPVVVIGPHVDAKAAPPPKTGPLRPEPEVRYGCQRVWRCDTTVCEWRRGCRGVYGYYEGPYFTSEFARRQWESHGLGKPPVKRKKRSSKKKTPAE